MEQLIDSGFSPTAIRPLAPHARKYGTVVLDVDSGISRINGLEWLASRRAPSVAATIADLTARVRDGAISPVQGYGEILAAISPTRDDMHELSRAYVDGIAPLCAETIARFRWAGVRVLIVSRGPSNAIYRLAYRLGFEMEDVHGINLRFDALGAYAGFDHGSPIARTGDRQVVVNDLGIEGPVLIVGAGPSERSVESFADLAEIVLG